MNKGRVLLLSKCAACNSEKLRFIKEQEGGMSSLGTGLIRLLAIMNAIVRSTR